MTKKAKIFGFLSIIILIFSIYIFSLNPSNDKNWIEEQEILGYGEVIGDKVSLFNIRNFKHKKGGKFEKNYYDKKFDLNKIKSLDYILVPFAFDDLIAHSFLSFGFEDGSYVSFSIEGRKEIGESYHPITGLFRKLELIYVIGDEKDLVNLRVNFDKDKVYLYPIKIDKNINKKLFLSILERANKLKEKPEFYNTIFDNCTIGLWSHLKEIKSNKVPFSFSLIFPGLSDEYLFNLGLIDTNAKNIEELRKKFLINKLGEKYQNSDDFSLKIRGE